MEVLAFNGSPRKDGNTAALLRQALDGAAAAGANTELIHLYDLDFKGCVSCFACKLKGGASYGRCAVRDALTPVLARAGSADGLILGSPIYFAGQTGAMRSLLERLLFPYLVYDAGYPTLFPRKIPTACIYTMNVDEERYAAMGYQHQLGLMETVLARVFGSSTTLLSLDTYQFDDYSRYVAPVFDPEHKAKRRQEVFPDDCRKAFGLGRKLAGGSAD